MRRILFFFNFLFITSSMSYAQVSYSEDTEYYFVHGLSGDDIRDSMDANRQGSFDGKTKWHVYWNFNWEREGDMCIISSHDVSISVKFILPLWPDEHKADANLVHKWNEYYAALIEHLQMHRKIGEDAADEINAVIPNIRSHCSSINNVVNRNAKAIIKKYNVIGEEYDTSTDHGMNNGAIFP